MRARGIVVGLTSALALLPAAAAAGHGTMQWPPSRTWSCYTEHPERPASEACRAAIALRGPQPDPSPSPSPTHAHGPDAWLPGVQYYRGDGVVHDGIPYSCLQTHVSQVDRSPAAAPALWLRQGRVHPGRAAS